MNNTQDTGRTVTAVVLIGLGILFLLGQFFNFSIFGTLWPLLVILPGVPFLYAGLNGGKQAAPLLVPGSIISGTGLILLYQNLTGHWESWAYAWLLYPVFLGLALTVMGERTGDEGARKTGNGFVRFGGIAFVVGMALFELVIFSGGGILGTLGLPLILIALGLFVLFRGGNRMPAKAKRDDAPLFTGANVVNSRSNGYSVIDPELQRKIDAALADDDTPDEKSKNG